MDEPLAADSAVRSAVHSAETRDMKMVENLAARSAGYSVASMAATTAETMDASTVVRSADLMDACWVVNWVVRLVVLMDACWVDLTAVWKDASMAAHSVVHWAAYSAAWTDMM